MRLRWRWLPLKIRCLAQNNMDAELITLIQEQIEKSDLNEEEKKEIGEALAVLPPQGLHVLYKAFELGPLHVRTFFESYKRKKDILCHKDMKAWRKLIGDEMSHLTDLI